MRTSHTVASHTFTREALARPVNEVEALNLSTRYETRLLTETTGRSQPIPAVVITGFLGSGKTTLVQHILRNKGSLKMAVLVNEVGQVDVDSALVNAKQGNAALGLSAADLSGGCVCCSRSEDLLAALHAIRNPAAAAAHTATPTSTITATAAGTPAASSAPAHPHSQRHLPHDGHRTAGAGGAAAPAGGAATPPDYLLVETSGAADAGPLADALVSCGFRLDCVVAVVDAEAGREALRHRVAAAQLAAADVVLLNKCDLLAGPGGLGALADLEDELALRAPGVRVVRSRFGEVPLTAVMDVEPLDAPAQPHPGGAGGAPGPAPPAAPAPDLAVGFMSHESVPSAAPRGYRMAAGLPTALAAGGLAIGSSRHAKRRHAAPAQPAAQHAGPHAHALSHTTNGAPDALHDGASRSPDHGRQHPHHQHPAGHSQLHSGFRTEALVLPDRPVSLAGAARFVLEHLLREPALLRCKGFLWCGERRRQRFTLHVSGRRRVELVQEGPWEGPPATRLVFIGTDGGAMRRLADTFVQLAYVRAHAAGAQGGHSAGDGGGGQQQQQEEGEGEGRAGQGGEGGGVCGAGGGLDALVGWLSQHDKLVCCGPGGARCGGGPGAGAEAAEAAKAGGAAAGGAVGLLSAAAAAGSGAAPGQEGPCSAGSDGRGCGGGVGAGAAAEAGTEAGAAEGALVEFSARGSPLHGIAAEELNLQLLQRVNAEGGALLVGVTAPGRISAATHVQGRDRVTSLLLPITGPAAALQQCLEAAVAPVMRAAYAHVHSCKCDVAGAVQGLR